MYLSKWKSLTITFLIFLAIYQTIGLWFENFSTHSFFYFMKNKPENINMQKDTLYLVESILINDGNNKYVRKYSNISSSEYKKIFDEAIYLSLKEGDFSYIQKFDINEVLNSRAIIYNYAFNMKGVDMPKIFNIKTNHISKITNFDTIIIIPTLDEKYNIKTIFLSSDTLNAYEFKICKDNLSQNIFNTINEFNNLESKDFYYISSEKSGITLFNKNQFLPKAKEDMFNINNIIANNPLEQDGGILLSESEKYVDVFFNSPITKSSSFINGIYTYNDEDVIVKYYPNGVLEYVKYKSGINTSSQDSPYNIAINFLNKDINIKNEYYLKDYKIEGNKIIFYFDYKINNFPIVMSKEKKEITEMDSMIEITVEESIVSKYKRLVYDFTLLEENTLIEKSFIEAIDEFLVNLGKTEINIDKMELIYVLNDINSPINIKWLITVKGNDYLESVTYGG